MWEDLEFTEYERRISPVERFFSRSPYSIVTMVARIKGNISENILRDIDAGTMEKIKEKALEPLLNE